MAVEVFIDVPMFYECLFVQFYPEIIQSMGEISFPLLFHVLVFATMSNGCVSFLDLDRLLSDLPLILKKGRKGRSNELESNFLIIRKTGVINKFAT